MRSIASSADIADDHNRRLWGTHPALKPGRGVEDALDAVNDEGPVVFGAINQALQAKQLVVVLSNNNS
jgi:hypothetical protein